MSYDIDLIDPVTKETLQMDSPHQMRGGTYPVGGTRDMSLNVTYNYARHFSRVLHSKAGIRSLYGLSGAEAIPILERGISELSDDWDKNYWQPTEGNAKAALYALLAFAKMRPDGIFEGD